MRTCVSFIACLIICFEVLAQSEVFRFDGRVTNNIEWCQNLVKSLKLQPASFARDTSLVHYYYQLATSQQQMNVRFISSYIDSAMHLSDKIKWEKGTALAYSGMEYLACMEQTNGFWSEAEELHLKIIRFYRSKNNVKALTSSMVSWANNLWDMGKYDKALKILEECTPLAESYKDFRLLTLIYINIGIVFRLKKMYPEAQLFYEKAYSIRNDFFEQTHQHGLDSLKQLVELKMYLIEVYLLNGQKARAEKMIPWVENINDLPGGDFRKYYANHLFASAYIELGELKKAERYALKCAQYAKSVKSLAHDVVVNTDLYQIYKGLGKYNVALKYLEELKRVESAIAFDKVNAKIAELQLKYDTEAQQQKIDQLTIEQQSRTQKSLIVGLFVLIGVSGYIFWNYRKLLQKNKEISTAMLHGQTTERKRVAADLHDNLGSTLSSIRWSMQAIDKEKLSTDEQNLYITLQEMLDKAHNDIRLLSHNLLPEELEKQGLWNTLQSFVRKLNKNTLTHFDLQLPDNQERMSSKIEFELYSICLELTNNILKHAQATEAYLVFERQNGSLHLRISDNGKGLDATRQNGKGLANVAARVEALGGKWEMESGENGGVVNMIIVPV